MANYFKLINITGSLPKRHAKKNAILTITYADKFKSLSKKLLPGAEMFVIGDRLPMNIQKLSLEKLIIINRVTENEYKRTQRKSSAPKPKQVVEPVVELIEEVIEVKPKRQYRTKKKKEETISESEN